MSNFKVGDKIHKHSTRFWTNDAGERQEEKGIYLGVITKIDGRHTDYNVIETISIDNPAPFSADCPITGGGFVQKAVDMGLITPA